MHRFKYLYRNTGPIPKPKSSRIVRLVSLSDSFSPELPGVTLYEVFVAYLLRTAGVGRDQLVTS